MRFFIDADLPRSTADLLRQYGYEAVDARDVGLADAKDSAIARYAQQHELCLLSGDIGFSNIQIYPPKHYPGLVVLKLPRKSTAGYILNLLTSFLKQRQPIGGLAGKLVIVEPGRVRIRSEHGG